MRLRNLSLACVLAAGAAASAAAQDSMLAGSNPFVSDSGKLRLKVEIKAAFRDSRDLSLTVANTGLPFPVVMQTVDPGAHVEVPNLGLTLEADLTPDVFARAVVNVLDLYNRNPTSSADKILLREAFVRFGKKVETLRVADGTSVYLELGKFPRFSKQVVRRLESYGLWGTAVGRFEETGAEAGGSFGPHVYWRASVTGGTPLFFRDPNALAGDNGTPERTVGSTTPVVYNSGFPILYDTVAPDVGGSGKMQLGGGAGLRWNWGEGGRSGVDVLAWIFRRDLADRVSLHGTFYGADLRLLQGVGVSLPIEGNEKIEWGVNVEARLGPVHFFGQAIKQTLAYLWRQGWEAELSWRIPLPGLFASGDQPVVNWIEPEVRISYVDNLWENPAGFVAPSTGWDWRKYDYGVRIGIVRGLDLTAEYARHDATTRRGFVHPDEWLVTLRAAF
ncbi:MAG TPA: hypothetical protein PLB01_14515 [Thermoanaerobaculia bacterium]|nr:hypothetical protein [Thermoanaerobaculia bacterium]